MSTRLEIDISLTDLADEVSHEIPGLQFFHSPDTYAAVKICEENNYFDDPEIGAKLSEHIERMRLLELIRHLGPADMATQAMGLLIPAKAQKIARKAAEKKEKNEETKE